LNDWDSSQSWLRSIWVFLNLLSNAPGLESFRIGAQNPEGRLIKEYDRAIFARHGWTQRLPFKLGKIGIFAGLGVAVDAGLGTMGLATAAVTALSAGSDLAVGATDEFVLSKILRGWKPNQFIEGPARQFLQSDPPSKRSP
jgi:hypothetical protein